MARGVLAFLTFFFLFYVGINAFRATTGQEKLNLLKQLIYSLVCTIMTLSVLTFIVVLF